MFFNDSVSSKVSVAVEEMSRSLSKDKKSIKKNNKLINFNQSRNVQFVGTSL